MAFKDSQSCPYGCTHPPLEEVPGGQEAPETGLGRSPLSLLEAWVKRKGAGHH